MGSSRPSRRRAVRLVPSALEAMHEALAVRWKESERSGKLTRDRRAEYLGVSLVTSDRIVSGHGVDRTTLVFAFKNLGLEWDDSFCEVIEPADPADPAAAVADEVVLEPVVIVPARSRWRLVAGVPAFVAVVCLAWLLFGRTAGAAPAAPGRAWGAQFNDDFEEAVSAYHRGDYVKAKEVLDRASMLAKKNDSAGSLSSALRVEGDLYAAQGMFAEASRSYQKAIDIRVELGDAYSLPALYEALGDAQTRKGDFASARTSLFTALDGFKKHGLKVGVAEVSRDIGSLYYKSVDLDTAQHWFEESLAALKGEGKPEMEIDVRGRQALILRDRGRFDEARRELTVCLRFWQARGHPRWIAQMQSELGSCEAAAGDQVAAIRLFEQSRTGFASVGDQAGVKEVSQALGRLASVPRRPHL